MPADGAVQIAFDRYLLPATVNRQSVVIVDGANQQLGPDLAPIVLYDPIARPVTLAPPTQPWLTEFDWPGWPFASPKAPPRW